MVEDMIETMDDAPGTGLAAPQVHVPLRVVVFFVTAARAAREADREGGQDETDQSATHWTPAADPAREENQGEGVGLTVLINPVIEPLGVEKTLAWEGCLSLPGLLGEVPRYHAIRYRALGLDGQEIRREATGFHARVVQHECDHLNGIVYPQRMTDLSRLIFTSEMHHAEMHHPDRA